MSDPVRRTESRSAGVVGRFAPTPSGRLHAGSLLAAVGSFLSARAVGGRWLVRIEDLDPPREVAGSAEAILADLQRLGLDWDDEVWRQSQRGDAYLAALNQLRAQGLVFACACSRQDLAPQSGRHSGPCVRPVGSADDHAWRLRVEAGTITVADRFQAPYSQEMRDEVGDFVLRRRDGYWAYHLAVVVDDAEQGVTEVIRGADLLDSTPRQMLLQRQLDLPTPQHGHLPLLLDAQGQKLSKSAGAADLSSQRPIDWLRSALRWLGQPPAEGETCSAILARAITAYSPERIPPRPSLPCRMPSNFGRE